MSITVSTVLAYAETKTQSGLGTINNTSSGVPLLNEALTDFRGLLIKAGINASQIQECYVPTVSVPAAGQGSTFAYPTDMFFLKTIEVNMLNTVQTNYVTAIAFDIANTQQNTSFDWYRQNQDTGHPMFDDRGDTYEIFPSFTASMNLTNAIKLFYFLDPIPYVNLTDNLTYPDTLDWYILAIKVQALYYESLNKFTEADIWTARYEKKVARLIATIGKGSQTPKQTTGIGWTGREF